MAVAMLAVLQRMHALGIIHRDVKLENIFIGAGEELKLGDFGLTMSMKQELAISPVGTVEYMAPEVCPPPQNPQPLPPAHGIAGSGRGHCMS